MSTCLEEGPNRLPVCTMSQADDYPEVSVPKGRGEFIVPVEFDGAWCLRRFLGSGDRNKALHLPPPAGKGVVQGVAVAGAINAVISVLFPYYQMKKFTIELDREILIEETVIVCITVERDLRPDESSSRPDIMEIVVRMIDKGGEVVSPPYTLKLFRRPELRRLAKAKSEEKER